MWSDRESKYQKKLLALRLLEMSYGSTRKQCGPDFAASAPSCPKKIERNFVLFREKIYE